MSNGDIGFCACQTCTENEGDCDYDYYCQGSLRCGSNNCIDKDIFGFDSKNTDCCYAPNVGDEDFCTTDYPCKINEGDCDSNDECQSNLFCGSSNCPDDLVVLPSEDSVDCCEPKGKS